MRHDVQTKINIVVDAIMSLIIKSENRITECALGSAQFVNYYIEKGIILSSEKKECFEYIYDYIDNKYFDDIPMPTFVKDAHVEMMMDINGYEYEKLISPIKKAMQEN
jgi:hypothetical protein